MARREKNGNAKLATIETPAGFDINVGREKGVGWLVKEEGNSILGRILGRYTFKGNDGKPRAYYQVKVEHSTKIIPSTEDGEETAEVVEPTTCSPGDIVNVDESAALSDLAERADDGRVYDVWFQYKAKESSKKGPGGFWPVIGPKLREIKGGKAPF